MTLLRLTLLALTLALPAWADGPSPVLRVLLEAPRHVSDLEEDDDERRERLAGLAAAIEAATVHRYEWALLLTQLTHESHAARFVHLDEPRCREGHDGWCDGGKSWSVFQLKYTDRTGGDEYAARLALGRLRGAARRCGYASLTTAAAVRAAVSGYAVGSGCRWAGADERVETWRGLLGRVGA